MKLRFSVRFVALALLFGALTAGAAPAEKKAAPVLVAQAADKAAETAVNPAASVCNPKASEADAKLQIALAPSLAWLKSTSQGLGGTCGSCGDAACAGMAVGAICGFDGIYWYACIDLYGNSCGANRRECFCTTSGPL